MKVVFRKGRFSYLRSMCLGINYEPGEGIHLAIELVWFWFEIGFEEGVRK